MRDSPAATGTRDSPSTTGTKATKTRAAILDAARTRFALHGFAATTIRAIADDANIDPAMVMRYFQNKKGLFAAATAIDLELTAFIEVSPESLGEAIARHFLDRWETPDTGQPLRVLLTTALSNSEAAEQMQRIFMTQLLPAVREVRGSEASGNDERAALIASQVLGFALCRYVIRLQPLVDLDTETAVAFLAPTIQQYLR